MLKTYFALLSAGGDGRAEENSGWPDQRETEAGDHGNQHGEGTGKCGESSHSQVLTLMLLVANLSIQNDAKKNEKLLKPWHMGTHLRMLSESYPMNTNKTGFRWFSKIFAFLCCGQK